MDIQRIVGRFAGTGIRPWLLPLLLASPAHADVLTAKAIDLHTLPTLAQILPALVEKQVVYVGEAHDQYSHHLVQLAVIRALHARHPDLAIGMEQFQQPFQQYLDAWVAGEIDEETLLRRTEYLERWRFDWRLYRPILQFAREQKIPIIALNVPRELTTRISSGGIESLSAEEKARLPEMDRSSERYRERIKQAFGAHPNHDSASFDRFLDAQLLWDEGMAARAADWLKANPKRPMVILAGVGHVEYRDGIPDRVQRRLQTSSAVVISDPKEEPTPELADFVLWPEEESLPPKGMLGISMEPGESGVRVTGFSDQSAAQAAGVEQDDRVVELDGHPTPTPDDLTLLMLNRKPGETVELAILRTGWLKAPKQLRYRIQLR